MLLSDLLSSSTAPAKAAAGGTAAKAPASDSGSFRQSFDQQNQSWQKSSAKGSVRAAQDARTQTKNGATDPQRPDAAKASGVAQTDAPKNLDKASHERVSDDAGVDGAASREVDESYADDPLSAQNALPANLPLAQGNSIRPGEGVALTPLHGLQRGLGNFPAAGVGQTGAESAVASLTTSLPTGDANSLLGDWVEPAVTTANALAAGKSPAATVAPVAAAPLLLNSASGLNKSFKLDNWQLTGIEGAIAAQLESSETPTTSDLNLFAASGLPGLGTEAAGGRLQIPVTVSFGQPQWASSIAERSAWLVSQSIESAEIQLDPPELGRVNVQIQVHNNEQASVTFTSANANVREALDQTSQRLRDLLAEQGLDLVNVDVSDHKESEQGDGQDTEATGGPLVGESESSDIAQAAPVQTTVELGIDHYV